MASSRRRGKSAKAPGDDDDGGEMDMMSWVDTCRPVATFAALALTPQSGKESVENKRLRQIAACGEDMPHVLLTGPPGCGKRTRIAALLHSVFHLQSKHLTVDELVVTAGETDKVRVPVVVSRHHMEVNGADIGDNAAVMLAAVDRCATQKTGMALFCFAARQEAAATTKPQAALPPWSVLVVHDAHCLSKPVQCALRWTMETNSKRCRVVMTANSPAKMIAAMQSRCCLVTVPAFSVADITAVLTRIAAHKGVPDDALREVVRSTAVTTDRDLSAAIATLQRVAAGGPSGSASASASASASVVKWRQDVKDVVVAAVAASSATTRALLVGAYFGDSSRDGRGQTVRTRVAKLVQDGVPPWMVVQECTAEVLRSKVAATAASADAMASIMMAAAKADHRIATSAAASEAHLDSFVVQVARDLRGLMAV